MLSQPKLPAKRALRFTELSLTHAVLILTAGLGVAYETTCFGVAARSDSRSDGQVLATCATTNALASKFCEYWEMSSPFLD